MVSWYPLLYFIGFSAKILHVIKLIPMRVRFMSNISRTSVGLPPSSILTSIAGVTINYPPSVLSYHRFNHVTNHNR